ncbi:MAG: hypothetical protein RPS47_04640 [Colwellia sp.]|jgi:Type II secretory pathway, component PulD
MNIKIFSALVTCVVFSGCSSNAVVNDLEHSRSDANGINERLVREYEKAISKSNPDNFVSRLEIPILSGRTVPVKRQLPSVFENDYFFNPTGDRSLVNVIKRLSSETGLVITARDDVYNPTSTSISGTNSNGDVDTAAIQVASKVRQETNLDLAGRVLLPAGSRYSGTVEGFLDFMSSVLNISWKYLDDDGRVLFTRYVESSYRLFVPPSVTGSKNSSDIWEDTKESISGLLSEGGHVAVNQAAGLITVVDTKDVQQMVKNQIRVVNRSLQRSVFFSLEVLSLRTSDINQKGLSLGLIHDVAESAFSLSGPGVSIPGSVGTKASVLSGPFEGSSIIAQNLRSKGEVSVSMSRVFRTMNNQTAMINQVNQIPVISSFTPPINVDGVVTPGGVKLDDKEVGFRLHITPAIMNDGQNMVVRINLESSSLDEIKDIPIGTDGQIVQSARTSSREYDHTFSMKNAQTIVISGYHDRSNSFQEQGTFTGWFSWLFGSATDETERTYYVILLTPEISNGSSDV